MVFRARKSYARAESDDFLKVLTLRCCVTVSWEAGSLVRP